MLGRGTRGVCPVLLTSVTRGGPRYGDGVGLGGTVLCRHRYGEGGVSDDEVEVCLILRVGVVVVRDGHGGVAFVRGRCQCDRVNVVRDRCRVVGPIGSEGWTRFTCRWSRLLLPGA